MSLLWVIIIGCFGMIWGSFLNMLIYRLPLGLPIVWDRSRCPHCRRSLKFRYLIPVFSFVLLRGKCGFCHADIKWRYLIVEIVSGLGAVALVWTAPSFEYGVIWWGVYSALIVLFFCDFEAYVLPDSMVAVVAVLALIYQGMTGNWMAGFQGAAVAVGLLMLIQILGKWVYHRDVLGWGDVKMMGGIGLLIGPQFVLLGIYLGFLSGGILSIGLLLLKRKSLRDIIPFGPFLIIGTGVSIGFGPAILRYFFGI